jgi:hypothetical protein
MGILIAAGGIALISLMTVGQLLSTRDSMLIRNDLEFSIALDRCSSRSVSSADPVFLDPGETREVTAGSSCFVSGPITRSGPGGILKASGPYLGCLIVSAAESDEGALLASSLDRTVGAAACDEVN